MSIGLNIAGPFLGLGAAVFLALGILFIRKATANDDPFHGVFISSLIGALIYLPLALLIYYPDYNLTFASVGSFVAAGGLGLFLGRAFYYHGAEKIGASWTAPIKNSSLLVSSVIGLTLLGETASTENIIGIMLITIGVATLGYKIGSENSEDETGWESYSALLLPIGAMLFIGLSDPLIKVGLNGQTPILVGLAIMHIPGFAIVGMYLRKKGESILYPFRAEQKNSYMLGGITLSIGLGILFAGLEIGKVVFIVPLKSTSPLFVLIFSYLFFRDLENITREVVIAAAIIVMGAIMIGISP